MTKRYVVNVERHDLDNNKSDNGRFVINADESYHGSGEDLGVYKSGDFWLMWETDNLYISKHLSVLLKHLEDTDYDKYTDLMDKNIDLCSMIYSDATTPFK